MKTSEGISYVDHDQQSLVYLDGERVGTIMCLAYGKGWFYSPKSGSRGDVFPTRAEVKKSLEQQ